MVALRSHDFTGLGFNICGNMRDGIFVKDVLHRGPASESGRIAPGTFVGYEVLTTVSNVIVVFWDVTPYSLVHRYCLSARTCSLHLQDMRFYPEDRCCRLLHIVGTNLPNCRISHPVRHSQILFWRSGLVEL